MWYGIGTQLRMLLDCDLFSANVGGEVSHSASECKLAALTRA